MKIFVYKKNGRKGKVRERQNISVGKIIHITHKFFFKRRWAFHVSKKINVFTVTIFIVR